VDSLICSMGCVGVALERVAGGLPSLILSPSRVRSCSMRTSSTSRDLFLYVPELLRLRRNSALTDSARSL
jgi:hypothetical protein